MEPSTAAAVVKATDDAAAEASKTASNLLLRLLGPSADVVGHDWAEKLRQRNLKRLMEKTQKRSESESDPGFTKPRLAASTFEIAQYADDEIVTEYLSGVLGSSRAPDGGHDGGIPWSALISRLSTDQLKLHYLLYASVRDSVVASTPSRMGEAHGTDVVLPLLPVIASIGLPHEEANTRLSDSLNGLMREGLVDANSGYSYGPVEQVRRNSRTYGAELKLPYTHAIRLALSIHGISLFMWGLGAGAASTDKYADSSFQLKLVDEDDQLQPVENAGIYARFWIQEQP